MTESLRFEAAPGGGGHWKVSRGAVWLGWVHRFPGSSRPWRAKPADGVPLREHFSRRRDAIAALLAEPDEAAAWGEPAEGRLVGIWNDFRPAADHEN
jgi:hypothetical protein